MLEQLKKDVYTANMMLDEYNLASFSWGNASGIDRNKGLVVIKPSGIAYNKLTPEKLVVVDLKGEKVEGNLNPSTDTLTHIHLYNSFLSIGGVVHTHSSWATAWAQARRSIPPYGTTHADFAYGTIPCTKALSEPQVSIDYELNTGKIITQHFHDNSIDPLSIPAVLVCSHGPFTWGIDCIEATKNAAILEEVAKLAWHTELMPDFHPIDQFLLDKHYQRKHGKDAYYGQK